MKKRKLKWKKIITILTLIIFTGLLIFSVTNIIQWWNDKNNNSNLENKISNLVKIKEINDNKKTKIIKSDSSLTKNNPYWDYIKMKLIDVDFTQLKLINKQTKGWIQVKGTNINYPFVQTNNNIYYLTHAFDKSYNKAGWVFLDYRNNINNMDKNTIIYAHGRLDKTMFGSLKNILKNNWTKNKNNYVVRLCTEKENSLWQVFSVYQISTTSDYLKINFANNEEFYSFASTLLHRSNYNFHTNISNNDKILTLSTCYNNSTKVVLHAKLIKYSAR